MNDDIHSSMLHQWMKKQIRIHPFYKDKLKTLINCMTYADNRLGVQIIANGQYARIIGPRPCNHSWACPECTARQMRKYSTRIGAALDALKKENYAATMFTLTIFHTRTQSCEESFTLLRKAWNLMDKQKTWRRKKKDGTYYVNAGVWSQFHNEFQFTHHVKTLETTYGNHGWHPHIHMLIWFKKDDLQKLAEWEEKLNEEWARCVDKAAKLLWGDQSDKYRIRKFLESKDTREDSEHLGLHISKTKTGKIKEWSSGDYICGWGGNNELTGLGMKIARKDNMTPFQILEKAHDLQYSDPDKSQKLINLYFDFAYTTLKHRISRIAFSRTGLKKIIDDYMRTESYKECIKKKKDSLAIKRYRNIAWFTKKQWSDICNHENIYLIPLILNFANVPDDPIFGVGAFDLISELLEVNGLDPPFWIKHPSIDFATAFNDTALAA